MKIYFVNNIVDEMFRQCNFSEKEKEFIKSYAAQGGDLNDLISFADDNATYLTNAMLGSATGALTAAMGSSRKKRKKAILKGALLGAGGGLLGGSATSTILNKSPIDVNPIPNIGAISGGGLAGYLSALHEDSEDEDEE